MVDVASLRSLHDILRQRRLTIAVAESCTGGLVAAALTELPGSSRSFLGGMVTYANAVKIEVLGVDEAMISAHGAVSAEVAAQMAQGARTAFGADVGIGVTGIAGPDSEGGKPVGLTFIAAHHGDQSLVREYNWTGDRAFNRAASVEAAISLAAEIVS
jgi:PncC family amidohydrolase